MRSKSILKTKNKERAGQFLGSKDPIKNLKIWLKDSQKARLKEPWAMHVSSKNHRRILSRIVLLKKIKNDKLIFFTNYNSRKAKDFEKHPQTCAVFYWDKLERQIIIQGQIKKTSRQETLKYWKTRERGSQISQWISRQSQEVLDRNTLKSLQKQAEKLFKNKPVPCPKGWGGFEISIKEIEFWQGRAHRLHDRFLFQKKSSGWKVSRLFP